MPFSGGYSPSPERTGGGDAGSPVPRLQRIFESLAARRGKAFDQTDGSAVGAENMGLARALDRDLYGANERFASEMVPGSSTEAGLLPRWERITGSVATPTDTETARQGKVDFQLSRFGLANNAGGVQDLVSAAIGALFLAIQYTRPDQANVWWPGYGGGAGYSNPGAKVTTVSGNKVTVANLTNVPTSAVGKLIKLSNCNSPGNDGTLLIQTRVSSSSVVAINNGSPVASDNGVGGSSGSPTIVWTIANQVTPFTSDVAHVLVAVNPSAAPQYTNPDGTLSAAFFAAVALMYPVLDWFLPADETFDWYVAPAASHGASIGFYLDEQNLDVEAFDG